MDNFLLHIDHWLIFLLIVFTIVLGCISDSENAFWIRIQDAKWLYVGPLAWFVITSFKIFW